MTRERLLAILGTTILRVLLATVRLRIEDPSEFSKNSIEKPVIICFWHNRILGITLAFLKRYPHRLRKGVNVLTSASRDGEILAQIMGQLGMAAVKRAQQGGAFLGLLILAIVILMVTKPTI